jgi:hypothetical protein
MSLRDVGAFGCDLDHIPLCAPAQRRSEQRLPTGDPSFARVMGQLELLGNLQMHSDGWPERRLCLPRGNEAEFLVKTFGV